MQQEEISGWSTNANLQHKYEIAIGFMIISNDILCI